MPLTWTLRERAPKHRERDGVYVFDRHAADAAVAWIAKYIRLPDGPHAGERYVLPPWQAAVVGALEGWRRPGGGRRYRRALIGVARGNSKSTFAAALGLKGLVGEGVTVPKVISAGTDRNNAAIIFDYAAAMVRHDKRLSKRLRVLGGTAKRILRQPPLSLGWYKVISSDAQHAWGDHPTRLLIDDLQAQPSRALLTALTTSQGTVADPLMVSCMTAGSDNQSVGWEEWDHALRVLQDPALDDELLVDLHYAERDDDWEDPAVWRKANPNLGISVYEDFLRQQVKRAVERPSVRNGILQNHFNIWTQDDEVTWITPEAWAATAGMVVEHELAGRTCVVGVVATRNADVASACYVFPPEGDQPYRVVLDALVPGAAIPRLEELHKISYRSWIEGGWLEVTEGDLVDERAVVAGVQRRAAQGWLVREVAYNPRGPAALRRALMEAGFTVTDVLPSFTLMSPAMNELDDLVRAKRIVHSGDRLLASMMGSLRARRNVSGDLAPDPDARVDISGAIALLLGLSRTLEPIAAQRGWRAV